MKEKNVFNALQFIFSITGSILCVYWFGWELFIVLSLFFGSNNIMIFSKIKEGEWKIGGK